MQFSSVAGPSVYDPRAAKVRFVGVDRCSRRSAYAEQRLRHVLKSSFETTADLKGHNVAAVRDGPLTHGRAIDARLAALWADVAANLKHFVLSDNIANGVQCIQRLASVSEFCDANALDQELFSSAYNALPQDMLVGSSSGDEPAAKRQRPTDEDANAAVGSEEFVEIARRAHTDTAFLLRPRDNTLFMEALSDLSLKRGFILHAFGGGDVSGNPTKRVNAVVPFKLAPTTLVVVLDAEPDAPLPECAVTVSDLLDKGSGK